MPETLEKVVMITNSASARGVRLMGRPYEVTGSEAAELLKGKFARKATQNDLKRTKKPVVDEE